MNTPYPQRHILVAVSGNTPQIVTETLWFLRTKEKIQIEAVYIITTSRGSEVAWKKLGGKDGAINRFCVEYQIEPSSIAFTKDHIIVIRNEDNVALDDIRSTADNHYLQAQMLGFIKRLTSEPTNTLHCLIGGGRRTMSAHMLLALTLYGREQDRLTHILVQEEFETNEDFFYPPKTNQPIAIRGSDRRLKVMHSNDHNLQLADIPVIRLRSLLGEDSQTLKDIEQLTRHLQKKIENLPPPAQPELVIDLNRGVISFNGQKIALQSFRAALFSYYAEIKARHCVRADLPSCGDCTECFQVPRKFDPRRFLALYPRFVPKFKWLNIEQDKKKEWVEKKAIDPDRLMSERTKINLKTEKVSPLLIVDSERAKGETAYGLRLDKNFIRILDNSVPAKTS